MDIVLRKEYLRFINFWLISLLIFIAIIVIVGGLTRLTDSGLSITEWEIPVEEELQAFAYTGDMCDYPDIIDEEGNITIASVSTAYYALVDSGMDPVEMTYYFPDIYGDSGMITNNDLGLITQSGILPITCDVVIDDDNGDGDVEPPPPDVDPICWTGNLCDYPAFIVDGYWGGEYSPENLGEFGG